MFLPFCFVDKLPGVSLTTTAVGVSTSPGSMENNGMFHLIVPLLIVLFLSSSSGVFEDAVKMSSEQ